MGLNRRLPVALEAEWLETDGLGGFAMGTVAGHRTRRYHAILQPAVSPPSGRAVLVNGFEAWVDGHGPDGPWSVALSEHRYQPDTTYPDGNSRLAGFSRTPWPTWAWTLPDGSTVEQELFVPHGRSAVAMRWRAPGSRGLTLRVRPLLSGRDSHAIHHENQVASTASLRDANRVSWQLYPSLPAVHSLSNASFRADPLWFRNFLLEEERARGFEHVEDLLSPGAFSWDLSGDAVWILTSGNEIPGQDAGVVWRDWSAAERKRRDSFSTPLHRAADAYVVRRGEGSTIIAGYPWFADWGRDTFIALRGIGFAGGRLAEARSILVEWAGLVSQGMLPNRFLEAGDAPEYNAVDASLWFVVAVHEFTARMRLEGTPLDGRDRKRLDDAVQAILHGYATGTRYGIRADADGLLLSGAPGVQLTWMDAKVGDWVVTPRWGKPVEVQALWLNALRIGAMSSDRWSQTLTRGLSAFRERFWVQAGGYLADIIDVEGRPGERDMAFRPNQLLAVAGLPFPLIEGDRARAVVDQVERRLWTPLGPRSLAPGEPGYVPHYRGRPVERDGAYHQGTVWPWLAGPFIEAWVKVRGDSAEARSQARTRFLAPLMAHLETAGLGHVSEVADADPPHTPGGCPFQAWSVGELLRLNEEVLHTEPRPTRNRRAVKAGR